MRLSFKKGLGIGVSALVLGLVFFQIFSINRSALKKLADERARLREQTRVPFEKKILTSHLSPEVVILQNTDATRDYIEFQNSYFAATSGGLVEFSAEGKQVRHFTVEDGLPESDLTCLGLFGGKLFIGTQTRNLVAFDGERFENYIWTDRKAQAVTSLLEADGKLLIGTMAGGLLEFDGENFTEIKAEKTRLAGINYLFKDGANLGAGTFDNGLWIYKNAVWSHFTTADGLPSNRVVGMAFKDKKLYVATDFGLAVLEEKAFRTIAVLPALSSLAVQGNKLFLSKADGEIFVFDGALREYAAAADENTQNARLTLRNEKLRLLSNRGISEMNGKAFKSFGAPAAGTDALTDNFISAITFDSRGNLWLGTFRRGIDVFTAQGKKLRHLETDDIREINYLGLQDGAVKAASSSGLINFKDDLSSEILTKKDDLPSNSITHFSGPVLATARGLAFRESRKIRVLSTVQGLPAGSVYTTLQSGNALYAGTLGGLAKIENGRVTQTFKDSNSNLTTNWVTALCAAGDRIFIGTYGGGIFELLPSGEIHPFDGETGKFIVNPNALFSDGERLYAGTLDGVKILDLQTQEWTALKKDLPADTILSVSGNEENVYFGTTNGIAQISKSYFRKRERE